MRTKLAIICLIPLFLLNMCAWPQKSYVDSNSINISNSKPINVGSYDSGEFGLYKFRIYKNSLQFKASTGFMSPFLVEVFDTDGDSKFDAMFTRYNGKWKFACKPRVKKNFKNINSNISQDFFEEHIRVAAFIKKFNNEKELMKDAESINIFYNEKDECWEAYFGEGDYE